MIAYFEKFIKSNMPLKSWRRTYFLRAMSYLMENNSKMSIDYFLNQYTKYGKRKSIWFRSYLGEPIVVIGARSSLFLPFKKLGLIIVDEEHDISYKQEDNIRYHARDIATVRAKIEKCNIILYYIK